MRKIFLILLLLVPSLVRAEEIKTQSEKERRYKYYYYVNEYDEKLVREGENDSNYPLRSNIYAYEKELTTSKEKPKYEEDIISEKVLTKYQEAKKVRYIRLDDITSNYALNLQEIEVWNNDEKLSYTITCSNECSGNLTKTIQNGIQSGEYNYIDKGVNIKLDLKDEYFPDDLTLKIYVQSAHEKTLDFKLTLNQTGNQLDSYYQENKNDTLTYYKEIKIPIKNVQHEERYEEEVKETEEKIEKNAKIISQTTYYTYPERMYLYYRQAKKYIDGYYTNLEGFIKDEEKYQDFEVEKNVEYVEIEVPVEIEKIVEKEIEVEVPIEVEKEIEVEVETIIEKEVPVIKTETELVEVEKIKEVEVPTYIEKVITKEEKPNYLGQYIGFLVAGVLLKKVSFFKGWNKELVLSKTYNFKKICSILNKRGDRVCEIKYRV